jgi:Mg2+/Co2+ transporter CorC
VASGVLGGLKTVIGFFARQNIEHSLNGETPRYQQTIDRALQTWTKPGFFESVSLGRFLLDAAAILSGVFFLKVIFPDLRVFTLGAVSVALSFLISHWLFPVLAQAFSPSLGGAALKIYRVYGFFFMGKLGELLYLGHELALKKLGIDPKLSFLGDFNFGRRGQPDDDENPDRSGLEEDEKEMIRSIFDLRETQVKEINTPRVDIVALESGASYQEVLDLVNKEKFSRIPVYKESIDSIVGILHVMDLMSLKDQQKHAGFKLADHIREAYFVPRTKKIGELLREFRQKHIHMAIVVDEYGGTSGLITLEDILEEIVGEIHDEDETETFLIRKLEEGVFMVDPVISLSDLNEELDINLKPDDEDIQIDTLGGFILFVHGKVPEKGDVIRFRDFSFEVMEMDGQKMEKVRMRTPILVNS